MLKGLPKWDMLSSSSPFVDTFIYLPFPEATMPYMQYSILRPAPADLKKQWEKTERKRRLKLNLEKQKAEVAFQTKVEKRKNQLLQEMQKKKDERNATRAREKLNRLNEEAPKPESKPQQTAPLNDINGNTKIENGSSKKEEATASSTENATSDKQTPLQSSVISEKQNDSVPSTNNEPMKIENEDIIWNVFRMRRTRRSQTIAGIGEKERVKAMMGVSAVEAERQRDAENNEMDGENSGKKKKNGRVGNNGADYSARTGVFEMRRRGRELALEREKEKRRRRSKKSGKKKKNKKTVQIKIRKAQKLQILL
ncbi:uncharacterized protein MONOS_18509 [Monocercomonoides exilis]|uniref:uncharacterized protein n=1 Tax=Monocercomonoides exilis TaxID=2049356 RepID=UPI00355A9616|nr:hypothetical protein MONOS_18509 [Monocercomonoides exilis]